MNLGIFPFELLDFVLEYGLEVIVNGGGSLINGRAVNQHQLEEQCEYCSQMELLAATAERASIKYKQVEFMGDHLGETFQGKISGITEFGFYVEVNDNFCEGMVPIHSLMDDYYEFDERNYCLRGRRHHHVYSIGDNVMIRVVAANLERRQLDFELVEKVRPASTDFNN